jgi:hypothetical protein
VVGDALVVAASSRRRAHSVVHGHCVTFRVLACCCERPADGVVACACGGGQEAGCPVLCANVLRCLGNRELGFCFAMGHAWAGLLGKMDCGTWSSGWLPS